ncbi:MAG: hypothetical protein CME61_02365 [Halobacteriovoraceae bacterium]|nr:hypothetical protein [Halobacteriovoraceae bacterium]|tara:strand:+ start:763 stop:1200 length:438 start_codon:yes stop_codon:yes gene_type:complete
MITFEITQSDDIESIGEFTFNIDRLKIGDLLNSNFVLYEKWFRSSCITLFISKDRLFLKAHPEKIFMVNDIKYSGSKLLKINDVVEIGKTKIKIKSFSPTFDPEFKLNNVLAEKKLKFSKENPDSYNLINEIENEIVKLELKEWT